jgi:hypothetical protein
MRLSVSTLALVVLALLALGVQNAEAFVKGSAATRARPFSTELYAVAKKAPKAKKASKAKKGAKAKVSVDSIRKPEFIASVAEKMDTTKAGAEAAVAAVLDTIADVSNEIGEFNLEIVIGSHKRTLFRMWWQAKKSVCQALEHLHFEHGRHEREEILKLGRKSILRQATLLDFRLPRHLRTGLMNSCVNQ